jgi:hypothetical protein
MAPPFHLILFSFDQVTDRLLAKWVRSDQWLRHGDRLCYASAAAASSSWASILSSSNRIVV